LFCATAHVSKAHLKGWRTRNASYVYVSNEKANAEYAPGACAVALISVENASKRLTSVYSTANAVQDVCTKTYVRPNRTHSGGTTVALGLAMV
jgi:hypothetical protein